MEKGNQVWMRGVHESELRVHPVVIKEQALARFAGQFQLLGFPVGPHLEAPAGFHARQHAHRALPHLILSRDLPCDLFLTHLAGWQIPHRSPRLLRRSQRSRLQLLAGSLYMLPEILQQHLVLPQVGLHARVIHNPSQRASKYQTIKTRQHSLNLFSELFDKLVHGVSSPAW